jgi:hypothetical protein
MATVHHRYATVDGHRLFYREADRRSSPCSATMQRTRRCIRSCTSISAAAVCRCWRCGVAGTRSSVPQAEAFVDDLPDADIHLLDGGHFLLESALDEVTTLIRSFLARQPQGV